MAATDIKKVLTDNIKDEGLKLASGLFPGVIQAAMEYYLNGISIPLGKSTSLKVTGTGAALQLEMAPVAFEGTATANEATLKVKGTGDYTDAYILVTFTKINSNEVSIGLDATMGSKLSWKLSDLWPGLLDHAAFNEVNFEKGHLVLKIDKDRNIDFTGTGDLYYKSEKLAAGAIRIVYNGQTTGDPDSSKVCILAGVVVESWSPGSIWSPLKDVKFKQSGLLFSALPEASAETLTGLKLFDESKVPSIVTGDFEVSQGITFFTTLELDNLLKPLTSLIGENQTLALYANSDLNKKLTLMAKYGASKFKPGSGAIFEFEDFELKWDIEIGSNYEIIASANGRFYPPDGSEGGIKLQLSSTIKPSDGSINLQLSIGDWVHPFGYDRLTVKEFYSSVALAASSAGVTVQLGGDFMFTTDDNKNFEFGVAGEVLNFETLSGIAFLLKKSNDKNDLSIGDLINGITSINTSSVPCMDFINDVLRIKYVDFAVVEGNSLHIGDKVFKKGFTAHASIDVLQQTQVLLDVEITHTASKQNFKGLAKMEKAVQIGNVFTLSAWNNESRSPDLSKGPIIAVASDGMVIKKIAEHLVRKELNADKEVYFYASGYLKVLDVIEEHLYGIATTDGLFEFSMKVTQGIQVGDSGTWGGYAITAGLNPETYSFKCSFEFNFGWKNVSIGPLTVFGVDLIPEVPLPNFSIAAGLGIRVDGKKGRFVLEGKLLFDLLGLHIAYGSDSEFKTIFEIDLGSAITSLSGLKDTVWDWLEDNITSLVSSMFNVLGEFVDWVKKNAEAFGLEVKKIAEAIYNGFKQTAEEIANILKGIGYVASEIYDALVNGLNVAIAEAEKIVDTVFDTVKQCAIDTAGALGTK